jgi:preprotein translocase subunit YajC
MLSFWLNLAPAQGSAQPSIFTSFLIPMLLMFGVFYLIVIRPQMKRQKEHQAMLAALQKGDRVVLNSGFYGKVARIDGDVVTVELADNVRVRVVKRAIGALEGSPAEELAATNTNP